MNKWSAAKDREGHSAYKQPHFLEVENMSLSIENNSWKPQKEWMTQLQEENYL